MLITLGPQKCLLQLDWNFITSEKQAIKKFALCA